MEKTCPRVEVPSWLKLDKAAKTQQSMHLTMLIRQREAVGLRNPSQLSLLPRTLLPKQKENQ